MVRFRKMIAVAAACLVLAGCSGNVISSLPAIQYTYKDAAVLTGEPKYTPQSPQEDMELILQKGYVALFVNEKTGDFSVEDLRNGIYYSSALPGADEDEIASGTIQKRMKSLLLTTDMAQDSNVSRTKSSYKSAYESGRIRVNDITNGVQIWYVFDEERYAIPVEITLCGDGFRVRICTDQIQENETCRLYSLSLLPYLFAQTGESDGYMLVPDGSGALLRFRSHKEGMASYYSPLYGEDYLTMNDYSPNVRENALLPVIGMQAEQGGFLAVAESGAEFGNVYATVDGQESSYNNIYFNFTLRETQTVTIGSKDSWYTKTINVSEEGPIAIQDISVRYYLLDSTPENGIATMAKVAGDVLDQSITADIADTSSNAMYISVMGGYRTQTNVLGVRINSTGVLTSVESAIQMAEQLNKSGISEVGLIYKGFDSSQLNGQIEDSLSLDKAVGSLAEYRRLAEQLGENRLFLTYNTVVFSKSSASVNKGKSVAMDLNLSPCVLPTYKRSTFFPDNDIADRYLLKAGEVLSVLGHLTDEMSVSLPGVGLYAENVGNMLYNDFSGSGYRRHQMAHAIRDTLGEMVGRPALMTDNANAYAAGHSSVIIDVPASDSGLMIVDEAIPFYQMVMSGKRQVVSRPLNTSGDPQKALLDCVRCGMQPQLEWTAASEDALKKASLESFFGATSADALADITKVYERYIELYEHIRVQKMVDYRILADGVTLTVYENGTEVLTNSSSVPYEDERYAVEAGMFEWFTDAA